MGEATRYLAELSAGDRSAANRLLALVYDELREIAARHLRRERAGHTLQTTALVNEAWLRMAGDGEASWNSRAHFFGVAAQAIRRVLVEHARRRAAGKRGGRWRRVTVQDGALPESAREVDLLDLDEALSRLAARDPRQARVVELRFFGGLSVAEAAHVLELSPRTVKSEWRMARAFLRRELGEGGAP